MNKKFRFILNGDKLTSPDNCESTTVRTGRDEELVFHSLGIESTPNGWQTKELYDALFPNKKRNKK